MVIWTTRLTRKKAALAVVLAGAAAIALILFLGRPVQEPPVQQDLSTNEGRVAYLAELGWQVEAEPVETLQLLLPNPLTEPYLSYNVLQRAQGFDLSQYCGMQIARYTYAVTNYPDGREGVQVNLYVCGGEAVAGDVCAAGADGFRNPLAYPESGGEKCRA